MTQDRPGESERNRAEPVQERIEALLRPHRWRPRFTETHVHVDGVRVRLSAFEFDFEEAYANLLHTLCQIAIDRREGFQDETVWYGDSSPGQGYADRSGRPIWTKSG